MLPYTGTKHIDPDTGLIYFKYDFGYEFGIILPGEGKATNGKSTSVKRARVERSMSKDEGGVEFPVLHEKSGNSAKGFSKTTEDIKTVPQFRPKKFTHFKSVKWEPTSESEMSEAESDANRWKRYSLPLPLSAIDIPGVELNTPSPISLSPSVPSLSPHTSGTTPALDSSGRDKENFQVPLLIFVHCTFACHSLHGSGVIERKVFFNLIWCCTSSSLMLKYKSIFLLFLS